ncbi:MAG: sigma 54-interacting transcriptional regulator, partial [Planctomycetota bacterium]
LPRRNLVARRDAGELEVLLVEGDAEEARRALEELSAALLKRSFPWFDGGPRPTFAFASVTYPEDGAAAEILLDALGRTPGRRVEVGATPPLALQVPPHLGASGARSAAMRPVLEMIARVARTNATVLLRGETGSGKEVVADLIQGHSERRDGPYVKVNCAAIPETLVETELFGHERGAFTGADRRRIGRFEQAHAGTLFLDEIGDLSAAMQVKLLRVLQERRITRVGGAEPIEVDVRILAATHRDLEEGLRAGAFREDLYHRLRVIEIAVPPLRERREEIPFLIDQFRQRFNRRHSLQIASFSPDALDALYAQPWPGNVRELRNVVERAMLMAPGPVVGRAHLPFPADARPEPAAAPAIEGLTPRQERILRRARQSGAVSNGDISASEGISARTALRELQALVERGLLQRVGRRRGATYRPAGAPDLRPA